MRKAAVLALPALAVAGYLAFERLAEARALAPMQAEVLAMRADLDRAPLTGADLPAATPPNIVLIVADDLGWRDVGYNGSEIATPVIDGLMEGGLELTRFYAHPTCTPTRAALMTGKSPMRLGISNPLSKNNPTGLPLSEVTLAERLGEAGYQTALVGKWHLGARNLAYHPNARGFDHYYGNLTGGVGYYDKVHGGGYDWQRNGAVAREAGYATHLLAEEATAVIEARDPARPLFLYAAFGAPHLPNEAPEEAIAAQDHVADRHRKRHAAMVSELDRAIGTIRDTLEAQGIADETLIWFLSDNGGLVAEHPLRKLPEPFFSMAIRHRLGVDVTPVFADFVRVNLNEGGSDNRPFSGGKQSVAEGGVRVPSFVHWPGQIAPGAYRYMATVQDIAPTLLELAGADAGDAAFDGRALWGPFLTDTPAPVMDYIIQTNVGGAQTALYRFPYKLVARGGEPTLYDLHTDPFEQSDIAAQHPEIVRTLSEALAAFPRGADIAVPLQDVVDDPDFFGGTEDRAPWAEQAYVPASAAAAPNR
ncbi:MAG: sulfatase-like hydrolase/transferase [Pseudomonadota bacterium]